jgi:NADPH-dependent 2,4-dienoyl-CoA reductase/sulfur reductase-like enzyme
MRIDEGRANTAAMTRPASAAAMPLRRRTLLRHAAAATAAFVAAPLVRGARAAMQEVVVVGAGWGGLAAAHALRRLAPDTLAVTVIDRERAFRSLPLSNPWLAGARADEALPRVALDALGARQGWRSLAADVSAIDRAARRVHLRSPDGAATALGYDWLVVATGAAYDVERGFGGHGDDGDAAATRAALAAFPPGFVAGAELDACRRGLDAFAAAPGRGGTLVLTVPPPPYRCPPAPYERAALLARWLERRRPGAKLVLIDAGGGMARYNRLYAERHAGRIEHLRHAVVRRVDARSKTIETDIGGVLRFDHALLLPAMHAGTLVAQAGLLERDGRDGRAAAASPAAPPARWAAVDADTLRSRHDDRVWVVGDALGDVSPLFGAYPKAAQIAAELGAAAAAQIVAPARGDAPPRAALPASHCHVWLDAEPREQLVIETSYRRRGDGVIAQSMRQIDNPQPRDEDVAWGRSVMSERLGIVEAR